MRPVSSPPSQSCGLFERGLGPTSYAELAENSVHTENSVWPITASWCPKFENDKATKDKAAKDKADRDAKDKADAAKDKAK